MTRTLLIRGAQGTGKSSLADFLLYLDPDALVIDEEDDATGARTLAAVAEHSFRAGAIVVVTELLPEDLPERYHDALVVELVHPGVE